MIDRDEVPDLERIDIALGTLFRVGLGQIRERLLADDEIQFDFSTYEVLATVTACAPVRVSDLARRIGVDASTISRHAYKLEKLGFLIRTADLDDRRVAWLAPSTTGARLVERRTGARRSALRRLLRTWSEEERQSFGELLEKFGQELEKPTGTTVGRKTQKV